MWGWWVDFRWSEHISGDKPMADHPVLKGIHNPNVNDHGFSPLSSPLLALTSHNTGWLEGRRVTVEVGWYALCTYRHRERKEMQVVRKFTAAVCPDKERRPCWDGSEAICNVGHSRRCPQRSTPNSSWGPSGATCSKSAGGGKKLREGSGCWIRGSQGPWLTVHSPGECLWASAVQSGSPGQSSSFHDADDPKKGRRNGRNELSC